MVQDYRVFFALLDWHPVLNFQGSTSLRGRPADPENAYLKAFLVRIHEGFLSMTQRTRRCPSHDGRRENLHHYQILPPMV